MSYDLFNMGSIPAWAGEPVFTAAAEGLARVYPRVGGGARQAF